MNLTKQILAAITSAELSLFSARTDPAAASFHLMEAARFAKRAAAARHKQQLQSQRNFESRATFRPGREPN